VKKAKNNLKVKRVHLRLQFQRRNLDLLK